MKGITLDSGALIAFERNRRDVVTLIARAVELKLSIVVPAGVVGQVWRDGSRQVRLVRLLASKQVQVESLDDERARAAGQLCGVRRTRDVIDASVVLCAKRRHHRVVTSDTGDMRRLDAEVGLIAV